MTATLPLQSWRMFASWLAWNDSGFGWRGEPVDDDRAGLRTAIEADAAAGAVMSGILRRMHPVVTQFRGELQTFWRARLNTKTASFAFFYLAGDVAARWACHIFLPSFLIRTLPSVYAEDSAPTWSFRSIRKAGFGNRGARSRSAIWRARGSTCHAGTRHR